MKYHVKIVPWYNSIRHIMAQFSMSSKDYHQCSLYNHHSEYDALSLKGDALTSRWCNIKRAQSNHVSIQSLFHEQHISSPSCYHVFIHLCDVVHEFTPNCVMYQFTDLYEFIPVHKSWAINMIYWCDMVLIGAGSTDKPNRMVIINSIPTNELIFACDKCAVSIITQKHLSNHKSANIAFMLFLFIYLLYAIIRIIQCGWPVICVD